MTVNIHNTRRSLRSTTQKAFVAAGETKTFQEQAEVSNNLPEKTRKNRVKTFSKEAKKYHLDRALAEFLGS